MSAFKRYQISPQHRITGLEYADDVILFVDNYDEMQIMLNNVSTNRQLQ